MKYTAKYCSALAGDLKGLPRDLVDRLDARIAELEADPFDARISKLLKGPSKFRTSRVGDWRILYFVEQVDRETWFVFITRIRHRRDVYRDL